MEHGWLSILPPLLAIGLALITRQVVLSLLLGVWVGALVLTGGNPLTALQRVGDTYLVNALADRSHAAIILFSTTLGGMVGILSRSGAMEGIVDALSRRVRSRRSGQTVTAVMGLAIFFDDYANTLLVGNTMRPLTDRLHISREKLAYLVDSTAAPVTTIAIISTWVGFEVGLIQDSLSRLAQEGSGYLFFLRSLPYNFYPILTLAMVFLVAGTGRDFGPMAKAEGRAAGGELLRPGAQPAADPMALARVADEAGPASPLLAAIPIATVVVLTVVGLWWHGRHELMMRGEAADSLREILNAADSLAVLMWSSLGGSLVAIALSVGARRLDLSGSVDAWLDGARAMLIAMVILILAWALGAVCDGLGTGPWLVDVSRDVLSPHLLPAISFLLAAAMSFSTGTSWGTMAILIPIILPLADALPADGGVTAQLRDVIALSSTSAVLAGAVFGDHCSPISDTTILSSMASGSDHVDHVRTQLPYALAAAGAAVCIGYLPAGFGVSPWISLAGGAALLAGLLRWRGRRAPPVLGADR
ncbi:Na+/H+ antiporter NhaC family protein [bacterium]|nr:Na+/H+ antiporter NhaC family protein [bacterium]MBU1073943.1 Na+/H+ antiporter NhaC family protein [bacterium]